MDEVANK